MDTMTTQLAPKPDHVPQDRVVDFDFYHLPHSNDDVHQFWTQLKAAPDFCWTPRNGGHWIATRARTIEGVQRNWELFSHRQMTIPAHSTPSLPLEIDPPEHTPLRALLSPLFTPDVLQDVERRAREITRTLIDAFIKDGRCEFSSQFARQLPIQIFLYLVDLPLKDAPFLLDLAEVRTRSSDGDAQARVKEELIAYLSDIIDARRANPGTDFISRVLKGRVGDREVSDFEAQNILSTLMFGGLDTVASMLGFVMRFLAQSPTHRRQLVDDPSLISKAVNELIRRHGLTATARLVTRDEEFEGVKFHAGDRVQVPTALVGFDEAVFPDPFTVDFNRPNASAHAAFGNGPHRCPGANLARMELKIVLEEWLSRIPDFRIDPNDSVRMSSGLVNSVLYLPLIWDVAA